MASPCASGGMALSQAVSVTPMVSSKGVFSPQFCSLYMLMTSFRGYEQAWHWLLLGLPLCWL